MTDEYLTLAITETTPGAGKYNVIAMNCRTREIIALELEHDEIITAQGFIIWDIGKITAVRSLDRLWRSTNPRNELYKPSGCNLIEDKVLLKDVLEDSLTSPTDFFDGVGPSFTVFKVRKVNEIIVGQEINNNFKCRVTLSLYDDNQNERKLLNKDYRWVNYWYHVNAKDLKQAQNRYVKLLNKKGKNLYIIVYRHFFKAGPNSWIAGMHWL